MRLYALKNYYLYFDSVLSIHVDESYYIYLSYGTLSEAKGRDTFWLIEFTCIFTSIRPNIKTELNFLEPTTHKEMSF